MTGPTVRETAAIFAWQVVDPEVEIVNADRQTFFPGEPAMPPATGNHPDHWVVERFHAARRVTQTTDGALPYHYEYAIHNMNSDTSADGFVVDFSGSAVIANAGFHDIDHHSGEPFNTTDWSIDVDERAERSVRVSFYQFDRWQKLYDYKISTINEFAHSYDSGFGARVPSHGSHVPSESSRL